MQLTLHTDLAMRLLIVLTRGDGEPLSLAAFSGGQGVSYNHMAKVAQELGRARFIESVRGRSGGVRLARDPAAITVGEVVRAMEPSMQIADCGSCALNRDCGLIDVFGDATRAFLATLDAQTLADVARKGPNLPL